MEDEEIVELYLSRSERAIEETARRFGRYCHGIARSLLGNDEDAEECVNDTYLAAWNAIPPHRPQVLATFLGKITRRISVDRVRSRSAEKRGGELLPILDELSEVLASDDPTPAQAYDRAALAQCINGFLASLPDTERRVFLCRYFYGDAIRDLARSFSFSESKVKSMLHRTRGRLRQYLTEEGYHEIP